MENEGQLYIEVAGVWEQTYCILKDRKFQSFEKVRQNVPASRSNCSSEPILEFQLLPGECETKIVTMGLASLNKLMKNSSLPESPFFFKIRIITEDHTYTLASTTEKDRSSWMNVVKTCGKVKGRTASSWVNTGFLDKAEKERSNRFGVTESSSNQPENLATTKKAETSSNPSSPSPTATSGEQNLHSDHSPSTPTNESKYNNTQHSNSLPLPLAPDSEDWEQEEPGEERLCGVIKSENFGRLWKVFTAFPFVIVAAAVSSGSSGGGLSILKSMMVTRVMNVLIYVVPVILVKFVLSKFLDTGIQRLTIGVYVLMYLLPVGWVAFAKLKVASATHKIEEGTFCFKPNRSVRWTQGNFWAFFGFFFEWLQHVLYVIPTGIITSSHQSRLSNFPPYLPFRVYFWTCVACTFACGLIIVLNAILRGKLHYQFQKSTLVWTFLFNIGSPMYVTIVTVLFMGLWCDFEAQPPVLVQDPNIICYGAEHTVMARSALMALAVYVIQNTLLPTGTFKETMTDDEVDVMFVPVYLQTHFLFKALFCAVYVLFYTNNFVRVIVLSFINFSLLALNASMKPCSVDWINVLRDGYFIHASISGIQSLNFLAWRHHNDRDVKGIMLSTLFSNILFSTIATFIYYRVTKRSTEYIIAKSFLDLEWQVSRGGSVHPRVLEPLISLTLSAEPEDLEIAKKYIGQLVWLISYPNMRVQFQSAWGLANLSLVDEDSRLKIHDAGGTKTLFEWYMDMDFVVQLEALAAMANLTLSLAVSEDMVSRYKCIPFFLSLVGSNKLKHSQFAAIALGNLARKETFRELIRKNGGVQILVGCIMSNDYQKKRFGCLALANMALSSSKEMEQVFESKGLMTRIMKMAARKEIETQREVVALIRNLCCHGRLRPLLLDRGIMATVAISHDSVFPEVKNWCTEITALMEKEIAVGSIDLKSLVKREGAKGTGEADIELLKKMEPLTGRVEWSTWGSKLESIFSPMFATIPSLPSSRVTTHMDEPLQINLANGLSKSLLKGWRDNMSFIVVEKPAHGKLNEYTTTSDLVTYTPSQGYHGSDFFTYRLQLGSNSTWVATVAITIHMDEEYDPESGRQKSPPPPSPSSRGEASAASPQRGKPGGNSTSSTPSQIDPKSPRSATPSKANSSLRKSTSTSSVPFSKAPTDEEAELELGEMYPDTSTFRGGEEEMRRTSSVDTRRDSSTKGNEKWIQRQQKQKNSSIISDTSSMMSSSSNSKFTNAATNNINNSNINNNNKNNTTNTSNKTNGYSRFQ